MKTKRIFLEVFKVVINIREATINDVYGIAKVHVDVWNTAYKNIVPEEYLKSRTYIGQEEKWLKRIFKNDYTKEFVYVAVCEKGEIIGFACGCAENDDIKFKGIISTIYILDDFQKQGIGKQLIKVIVERLYRNNIENLIIWAFEENLSCTFYEHIGGQKTYKKNVNMGGKELLEIGYCWTNLKKLLGILK